MFPHLVVSENNNLFSCFSQKLRVKCRNVIDLIELGFNDTPIFVGHLASSLREREEW